MITDHTRAILLTQLKKRAELIKLNECFERLKVVYFELAFESLSEEESEFYTLAKRGVFGDDEYILITQSRMDLSRLLPAVRLNGYFRGDNSVYDNLKGLGYSVDLLTGITHSDLSSVSKYYLTSYTYFDFPEPVPLFLGVQPTWQDLEKFKLNCKKELYNKFFEVTNDYLKSFLVVATILGELDSFLSRGEVTVAYLNKNFKELYNLIEDGKKECNNQFRETNQTDSI